jgi:uncharacterized protein YndB with AHSA1/START domain
MIATLMALALAAQAPAPALRPGLEPLGFLVGHCWQGTFATGEQDTHCFETAYDGQHVRDQHRVTGGARLYRGETLFSADGQRAVTYTYWNSIGGVSRGAMQPRPDRLDFGVETYRGPDGRESRMSTFWRRVGDDAYEAVTESSDMPSMNRTVTYRRVADTVPDSSAAVSATDLTDVDGSHTLVHETLIQAPADQVWQAISTAEGWTGWAVPVAWMDGDLLETSYTPGASRGDPSTIRQQIVARISGRLLVFRTTKAPEGFPNFETFRQVVHVLEVEPGGPGQSRVRLTGSGYPDTDAGRQLLGFFRDGNRVSLERLRQRFASGPLDWNRVLRSVTASEQ